MTETELVYELRANIIKSLAHPTRLFILDMLTDGPKCVCEIDAQIKSDLSTTSKHLSILNEAGIISKERQGKKIIYSIKTPCIMGFFSCIEQIIQQQIKDRMVGLGA